jgi:hypothetical protein
MNHHCSIHLPDVTYLLVHQRRSLSLSERGLLGRADQHLGVLVIIAGDRKREYDIARTIYKKTRVGAVAQA